MSNPPPDFWKQYWEGLYATPRAWAHQGERLIHAFEAVLAATVTHSMHLDMRDQAFMLAGMAIEVQIKAILVSRPSIRTVVTGPRTGLSSSDTAARTCFYNHDLVALAQLAGVAMTDEQRRTAAALTQYIVWRGRYVLPTNNRIEDLQPTVLPTGLVGQAHNVSVEDVLELVEVVVTAVKSELY